MTSPSETRLCPFCSETIQATARKCKHCGEWLTEAELFSVDPITLANSAVPMQARTEFVDPWVRESKKSEDAAISKDQQRRFVVGEKYDRYYRKQFERIERGERSLNWAAGLLTVFWLFYRRQSKRALLVLSAQFALQLPVLLLARSKGAASGAAFLMTPAVLAVGVLTGLLFVVYLLLSSNKAYLEFVDQHIAATKTSFGGSTPRTALVEGTNTSVWRALLYVWLISMLQVFVLSLDPLLASIQEEMIESISPEREGSGQESKPVESTSSPEVVKESYSSPKVVRELVMIASLTGTCERLIVADEDATIGCPSKILQNIYDDRRTSFVFPVGDKGSVITFSGIEGDKPDADSQLQSVDMILVNLGIIDVPSSKVDVSGHCLYGNPYKGPMLISCESADSEGRTYLLQFRTDGRPPSFTEMKRPDVSKTASFDCSVSNLSKVEQAICTDGELTRLDGTMAELYKRARAAQRTSIADQRAWLVVRARCGSSAAVADCLRSTYRRRIRELQR